MWSQLTSIMTELRVVRQLGVFGLERHGDCRMIVECERDEGRGCLSGFCREWRK
jgi:hypothetical protein